MWLFRDIAYSSLVTMLAISLVGFSASSFAQVRSSSNYQLESDSINVGGGLSNSSNFSLESTAGEIATGRSTGTNFSLQAGYQQLDSVFISLAFVGDQVWQKGVELTIDAANIDETLTDFPVYVDLADLGSEFWAGVQSDGRDIRVTSSDGVTEVPYEIVSINAVGEAGELYFKAPVISSSTDSTFFIYYDNEEAISYLETDEFGSENVWTNNFEAVYHLSEDPSATAPQMKDSTSNNRDLTSEGAMTSGDLVSGQLGGAIDFDGSNDALRNSTWDWLGNEVTVTYWNNILSGEVVESTPFGFTDVGNVRLSAHSPWTDNNLYFDYGTYTTGGRLATSYAAKLNKWSHIALSSTGSNNTFTGIYLDGALASSRLSSVKPNVTLSNFDLGNGDYRGRIDEFRVSGVSRSAAWISAEYINQFTSTAFYATTSVDTVTFAVGGANVFMTPDLPGLTGGTSNGSTTFIVTTDSPTGYQVTLQASDAPAMQSPTGSSIGNYNNGDIAGFAFTIPTASAVFGFSPEGVDVADQFLDDTVTCGVGSTDTPGACWAGVSTTPITIVEATAPNQPTGATTTIQFQVGLASGANIESGVYTATTTLTALPL